MNPTRSFGSGRWQSLGPVFIRIPVGLHLIHGTQDNVFAWERMLEFRDFLATQGFPLPLICAVVSVYAQFISGALYLVGWKTRAAAAIMVINFVVALVMVHRGGPYAAAFPAIMMLAGSLSLLCTGPGAYALDSSIREVR